MVSCCPICAYYHVSRPAFDFRSTAAGVQIDRTAVHRQQQMEHQSDQYSMYHSKVLQAELRHLDAQKKLSESMKGSANIT